MHWQAAAKLTLLRCLLQEGAKHGLGMYRWPTGATFRGEWMNGCMHGVGTFESPDGTRYQGGWAHDLKQGLGKKTYANGDCYEVSAVVSQAVPQYGQAHDLKQGNNSYANRDCCG